MKKKNIYRSKTLWLVVVLWIIALEPFIPQLQAVLPPNLAVIGSFVFPSLILFLKVMRDQGLLMTLLNGTDPNKVVSKEDETEDSSET